MPTNPRPDLTNFMRFSLRRSAVSVAVFFSSSVILSNWSLAGMKGFMVVLRKQTASNWRSWSTSKLARSSETTVVKVPVFLPSSVKASLPVAMEAWRKPAVFEKMRSLRSFLGVA